MGFLRHAMAYDVLVAAVYIAKPKSSITRRIHGAVLLWSTWDPVVRLHRQGRSIGLPGSLDLGGVEMSCGSIMLE
jgi:hypothetical protein